MKELKVRFEWSSGLVEPQELHRGKAEKGSSGTWLRKDIEAAEQGFGHSGSFRSHKLHDAALRSKVQKARLQNLLDSFRHGLRALHSYQSAKES